MRKIPLLREPSLTLERVVPKLPSPKKAKIASFALFLRQGPVFKDKLVTNFLLTNFTKFTREVCIDWSEVKVLKD